MYVLNQRHFMRKSKYRPGYLPEKLPFPHPRPPALGHFLLNTVWRNSISILRLELQSCHHSSFHCSHPTHKSSFERWIQNAEKANISWTCFQERQGQGAPARRPNWVSSLLSTNDLSSHRSPRIPLIHSRWAALISHFQIHVEQTLLLLKSALNSRNEPRRPPG